jgi:hypothetical protein
MASYMAIFTHECLCHRRDHGAVADPAPHPLIKDSHTHRVHARDFVLLAPHDWAIRGDRAAVTLDRYCEEVADRALGQQALDGLVPLEGHGRGDNLTDELRVLLRDRQHLLAVLQENTHRRTCCRWLLLPSESAVCAVDSFLA